MMYVGIMSITYQAEFQYRRKGELSLTRTLSDGTHDTSPVDMNEIRKLEELSRNFDWNQSQDLSRQVGEQLFAILNGDTQAVVRSLKEADDHGERLRMMVSGEGPASDLPFELLYHNSFIVPSRAYLTRQVSDRGRKRSPRSENRPLKILFMACSPTDAHPVLEYEKEEETILEVTDDLPVELHIEDTGSLEGLGEQLAVNEYDVVHITGHADIDDEGDPFFWMEDEEGLSVQITPSQLWEKLRLNLPGLVFLSGCRTGEAPRHDAASFAHHLVSGHVSTVLGWGLPVSDVGARSAAKKLYFELSRGKNILDAVFETRYELFTNHPGDWSLLRLFSDGTPLSVPLVREGQKIHLKPRKLQYRYLEGSQVKVLEKGFIGRRGQIQQGLFCLRKDREKIGLLLHGTGGLGKSCLAGKFCERFSDHVLIIVHGRLNELTFHEALKDGFIRGGDAVGEELLKRKEEPPDKIRRMCYSVFQEKNYLILLDDFEQNLEETEEGKHVVSAEAEPILESLLRFLPYSGKMTQLIITSRYEFSLTIDGSDLVRKNLKFIGLTSFLGADKRKKVIELTNIRKCPDGVRQKLIELGKGNPSLLDQLNELVGVVKHLDLESLLSEAKGKQEEFIRKLVLRRMIGSQSEEFQRFLRRSAVYRLPVLKAGIELVCGDLTDWRSDMERAVRLSLMEEDSTHADAVLYWVTPLMGEDIFGELGAVERRECHQVAVSYYQGILSASRYDPLSGEELIEHALNAGLTDIAVEEAGGRFLPYLRESLAYKEALMQGGRILSHISEPKRDAEHAKFMYEMGRIHQDIGGAERAIEHYEQALSISKEVYGDRHHDVATTLSSIGMAWDALADPIKAIEYHEQALSIDKELYGDRHHDVATDLNNIGMSWQHLGEPEKAIEYFEQALSIVKEVYGKKHPPVAAYLNNIGMAWHNLGEPEKAIEYLERALSIDKEVYRDRHPCVATELNNIGLAWHNLGEHGKAIEYCEQALSIDREVYGERHPDVARDLNNIGSAWHALGDRKRSKTYLQQAYSIFQEFYGDEHPHTIITKKWLEKSKG
jgi:tetratricopeptide (TPR) repeat protein